MPVSLIAIEDARRRIERTALRTPLVRLNGLDIAPEIYLKLENLQPIRSFKIRGAANAMAHLSPPELQRGVLRASAGNMAQGVAWRARWAFPVRRWRPTPHRKPSSGPSRGSAGVSSRFRSSAGGRRFRTAPMRPSEPPSFPLVRSGPTTPTHVRDTGRDLLPYTELSRWQFPSSRPCYRGCRTKTSDRRGNHESARAWTRGPRDPSRSGECGPVRVRSHCR
jgi:Pyridoxal-phosphate dependent enzyme